MWPSRYLDQLWILLIIRSQSHEGILGCLNLRRAKLIDESTK